MGSEKHDSRTPQSGLRGIDSLDSLKVIHAIVDCPHNEILKTSFDQVIQLVSKCGEQSGEVIQLAVLRALLTIGTAEHFVAHGDCLMQVFFARACVCGSKSLIRHTALESTSVGLKALHLYQVFGTRELARGDQAVSTEQKLMCPDCKDCLQCCNWGGV